MIHPKKIQRPQKKEKRKKRREERVEAKAKGRKSYEGGKEHKDPPLIQKVARNTKNLVDLRGGVFLAAEDSIRVYAAKK